MFVRIGVERINVKNVLERIASMQNAKVIKDN